VIRGRAAAVALSLAFVGGDGAALAQQPPVLQSGPKLTKAPKLVRFVEAHYPEAERAAGQRASVVLQIAISASGTVDQAVVKESGGAAFDAAAVEAAKQFVFEPAEIDGKPAAIRILYKYEFTLKAEVPTKGVFDGTVRDRASKAPLSGVKVELGSGQRALTDARGHFHFDDVPPGKQSILLSSDAGTPVRTEETFEAGKQVTATYDVDAKAPEKGANEPQDDLEIVVQAPPLEKQVVTTEVSAEQARKVPGAQGDVLKVVENMPGVGRPPAGSGQLVVWGAAPQDTRVYIDGVRVPLLYHFGGYRSVISSDFVKSVDLAPGGYGASYGRGLGGLVTVELQPLDAAGFHGSAGADLLDAGGAVSARVSDQVSAAIAYRKSYLDALVPLVTSKDVGELFPIARYSDGQVRVGYSIRKGESIEAGGFLSSDAVDRTVASADPETRDTESQSNDWWRVYLRYRRELEGGGVVSVVPSFGVDDTSLVSHFGGTSTELETHDKVYALRATYRGAPKDGLRWTAGLDAEFTSATVHRIGSVTSPPREGDVRVFGQAPSDQISADTWDAVVGSAAAFVEADLALFGERLHITPGLRFEPYVSSASRRTPVVGDTPSIGAFVEDTNVEPRLAIRYAVSPRLAVKAAWGLYHQSPAPEDLSAVFGNPLLGTSEAQHVLAGAEAKLTSTLSLESTGFYTASTGLAARSASPTPLLAEALQPIGSGRAYGIQILLRQEIFKGFFGWVSYGLLRSERQDTPDGRWRLFDQDQTHVVTAIASYDIGAGFEAGVRLRAATGFPRTPVVGAYYDARVDAYQPVFGAQNSERIPPFFQADARIAKRFTFGKTTELEIYLDVQNVTDRQNPEEIVYSRDYSQRAFITGLPILPVAGARLKW
jgi:TonB family protein